MSFLAPIAGLIAAGLAVPLLVLMYFLKLKRKAVPISSTFLWQRAVRDLQVNSPFQRIRWNILLLLQLLLLATVLLAIARPVISLTYGPPKRYVILIDRSASMNATDVKPTRLAEAKRQAKYLVDNLRSRPTLSAENGSDQAMIVAFDEHAKVMCNFTADKSQLKSAIDAIEPSDGPTSLAEAITVAKAFTASPGVEANNSSSKTPAQLELFSDGQIADASGISLANGELIYHKLGNTSQNLAITAMQARRDYDRANEVEIFATLANFSPHALTCDVQMTLDGGVRSVKSVTVPPRKANPAAGPDSPPSPGTVSLSFSLTHSQTGLIEVRQMLPDALPDDDAAWAILPPPKNLSVLLVSPGNAALESAFKACSLSNFEQVAPAQFDTVDQASITGKYDVIVLDRHAPEKLPPGRYIVFGQPPRASGLAPGPEIADQTIVDWRTRHPILQFVNLNNVFASKAYKLALPVDTVTLAEFGSAPAMALVRRGGSVFLLVQFDCMETNWPFEPGFVMFCFNAANYLGLEVSQDEQYSPKVNQAITIENLPAGTDATIYTPDKRKTELQADNSGVIRYSGTTRAGVYFVAMSGKPLTQYAVNMLDARESNIEPASTLELLGQKVAGQEGVSMGNMEIWPHLLLAAMVLVCLEWVVYNLKMRL